MNVVVATSLIKKGDCDHAFDVFDQMVAPDIVPTRLIFL